MRLYCPAVVVEHLFVMFAARSAAGRNVVSWPWLNNAQLLPKLLAYVNRLSDYLFVLSREKSTGMRKKDEIFWDNSCK